MRGFMQRNKLLSNTALYLENRAKKLDLNIDGSGPDDRLSLSYTAIDKENNNLYYIKEFYPESEELGSFIVRAQDQSLTLPKDLDLKDEATAALLNLYTTEKNEFRLPYLNYLRKQPGLNEPVKILPDVDFLLPQSELDYSSMEESPLYVSHLIQEEGYSLEQFIEEGLKKNIYKNPVKSFRVFIKALKTIVTLTEELSSNNNYYLDIVPDNFQFKNDFKNSGEHLYLRHLNFLYKDSLPMDNTDLNTYIIKSVGEMLRQALGLKEPITELDIESSSIFHGNDALSTSDITSSVYYILKHCLTDDETIRYKEAKDLEEDLEELATELKKIKVKSTSFTKKSLRDRRYNRKFNVANTLFRNPIPIGDDDKIKIAVFGLGNSGSACVDACLQLEQIEDKKLEIFVFSHWIEMNARSYLKDRPNLYQYVSLDSDSFEDESLLNPDSPYKDDSPVYAKINFKLLYGKDKDDSEKFTLSSKRKDIKKGSDTIFNIATNFFIDEEGSTSNFDAIFVCFGEDQLNKRFAESLVSTFYDLEISSPNVYYVLSNDRFEEFSNSDVSYLPFESDFEYDEDELKFLEENAPVPIFVENEEVDPVVERMGFSLHSVWNDSSRENLEITYDNFKNDLYHYSSSIISALGLLNNLSLFGTGQVMSEEDLQKFLKETAGDFSRRIKEEVKSLSENVKKAVQNVHKNWLLGKVTDGWGTPFATTQTTTDESDSYNLPLDTKSEDMLDYNRIVAQPQLKNTEKRLHPRILPTNEELDLQTSEYSPKNNKKLWTNPSFKIPEEFDPMNRASIKIHRANLLLSQQISKTYPINLSLDILKIITENMNPYVPNSLDNLILCLKNCQNGNQAFSYKFKFYLDTLRSNIAAHQGKKELTDSTITSYLDSVESDFKPLVRSNVYRDLKSDNLKILENIPFILTNKEIPSVVQALRIQDENDLINDQFRNILSACLLNPKDLTYLVYVDTKEELDRFCKTFLRLIHFYEFYGCGSKLNFRIYLNPKNFTTEDIVSSKTVFEKWNDIKANIPFISHDRGLESIIILNDLENENEDVLESFTSTLDNLRDKGLLTHVDLSQDLFKDEQTQKAFVKEVSKKYKLYKIRPETLSFYELNNCDELAFLPTDRLKFTGYDILALNPENLSPESANTYAEARLFRQLMDSSTLAVLNFNELLDETISKFSFDYYIPDLRDTIAKLWRLYIGNRKGIEDQKTSILAWEKFSRRLSDHFDRDPLSLIELKRTESNEDRIYFYSDLNYDFLKVILEWLIDNELVSETSELEEVSSDTSKLLLKKVCVENISELEKLLDFSDYLLDIGQLEFSPVNPEVRKHLVKFKDLKVRDLRLEKDLENVLNELDRSRFISNLRFPRTANQSYAFDFSFLKYREILSDPVLLPLFNYYYSFIDSLEFDDVSCVVIQRSADFKENDKAYYLILTNGSRSTIVYVSDETRDDTEEEKRKTAEELKYLVTKKAINPSIVNIVLPRPDSEGQITTVYDESLKTNLTTIDDLEYFLNPDKIIDKILEEQN